MSWMETCPQSRRHPQVLIGLVVASLLVMVGFQAPSGIKPLSKTSRLERLQTVETGKSFSPVETECDSGSDHGCGASLAGPVFAAGGLRQTVMRVLAESGSAITSVAHAPQAFRDFASVVPRAPPRLMS